MTKRLGTDLQPYAAKTYPDHGLADEMTERGRRARGFYITPMYLRALGPARTAAAMKRGKLDTVVVDMKDDLGHLTYPSRIPLGRKQVRALIRDPVEMVKTFHEQGMYVIARVVAFKDSRLPYVRPDLAVRIGARAQRLYAVGENWLDAYSPEVQDYIVDVALELQSFGFDEIQFDYVRFPRGSTSAHGIWLHAGDKPASHATVVTRFLEKVDRAVKLPISADVFGLTTLVDGDPRGLGQDIERMAKYVEAISPMMYANGMDAYFRNHHITSHVINIIQCGLQRARRKAGDIVLRPYLQGYSNGVEHMWGPEFVLDQVRAALNAGSEGYLFWNPTMRNHIIMKAMREFAAGRGGTLMAGNRPRPSRIRAAWCPMGGNVFGTAAEREKKGRRPAAVRAQPGHKTSAARCGAGACSATP
ncbi:MAG: hypothetical protein JXP73_01785 [Deltaproteobacteria bacterium]|nr:hypothetical protein [Deltaproteobacteria bacterium]